MIERIGSGEFVGVLAQVLLAVPVAVPAFPVFPAVDGGSVPRLSRVQVQDADVPVGEMRHYIRRRVFLPQSDVLFVFWMLECLEGRTR